MQGDIRDESILIRNWKAGDDKSFDVLFHMHFSKLHQFALRHTNDPELAREMVMDMMLKVWQRKHTLKDNTLSLAPFLFHLLKAALVDFYRKKKLELASMEEIRHEPADSVQADSPLQVSQLNAAYRKALEQLTPRQRMIFEMRYEREMAYSDIATELELSIKTVDRHLCDAVSSLRKYIRKSTTAGAIILLHLFFR